MTAPLVVCVEDDAELRDLLVRSFREEDLTIEGVGSGGEFLQLLRERIPDVVVMDVGLPDADGRDVCHAMRAAGIEAPVLFLTAYDNVVDRIAGFNAGGDDYVAKPFSFREVLARVHALLRRATTEQESAIGGARLDPASFTLEHQGDRVHLSPTEFRVLARLAAAHGDVVRRTALLQAGWGDGAIVHDNTLDTYIARLRRKLRAAGLQQPLLETVPRIGYALR